MPPKTMPDIKTVFIKVGLYDKIIIGMNNKKNIKKIVVSQYSNEDSS